MRITNLKSGMILLITMLIISALFSNLSAAPSGLKAIEKLEEQQRLAPTPETIETLKIEYNSEGEKDPFQSPIVIDNKVEKIGLSVPKAAAIQLPQVSIQGLIWGGSFPQAIINNKVVRVGDKIDEMQVINIGKNGITLFFKGKEFMLPSPASTNASYKNP